MAGDAGRQFLSRPCGLVSIVDVDADLQQIGAVEFRPHMGHERVSKALAPQTEVSLEPISTCQQLTTRLRRRGRNR